MTRNFRKGHAVPSDKKKTGSDDRDDRSKFSHGAEQESLGLKLEPGDPHYRAYVGPPAEYDLIAAMSFNLLTTLGLRQYHRCLDIGCGSLRIGRLLIPYLNQGCYTGIEPNEWLVREGIEREIGKDLLRIKKPRFLFASGPEALPEDQTYNFALAQSIFSHCTPELIRHWLKGLFPRLRPRGALVATFKHGAEDCIPAGGAGDKDHRAAGWVYPKCLAYRPRTIEKLAHYFGYKFQLLEWSHPRQTWALFAREEFDTAWFAEKPLTWNNYLESRRTKSQAAQKNLKRQNEKSTK
jgi:SAM-dependent methyltransferase